MKTIARSRSITAPTSAIWETLADFGALADWVPRIDHSELITDGPAGVGMTRRVQVKNFVLLERVVDWQPGETLAYEIIGLPQRVRQVENRWAITSRGERSDVSITTTVDLGARPPQQAAAAGLTRVLGRVSDDLLTGLATHFTEDR